MSQTAPGIGALGRAAWSRDGSARVRAKTSCAPRGEGRANADAGGGGAEGGGLRACISRVVCAGEGAVVWRPSVLGGGPHFGGTGMSLNSWRV